MDFVGRRVLKSSVGNLHHTNATELKKLDDVIVYYLRGKEPLVALIPWKVYQEVQVMLAECALLFEDCK